MQSTPSEKKPARDLWLTTGGGLPERCLDRLLLGDNPDVALNSSFKIASAAQTAIGLAGLSAAYLYELQTGVEQTVKVDARQSVLNFRSEAYYTLDEQLPGSIWDAIAGLYKTKDDRFVRIHTNFPHHRNGILNILGLSDSPDTTRDQVQEAFKHWNAYDFEEQAAKHGMCAFALRSFQEWDQHSQARALVGTPPVTVTKIGEAPKRIIRSDSTPQSPLEGIKVLDLSRVLAGPIAGRTLAAHGADVLLVTSPSLPALPNLDVDTSRGKRTTQLDLTQGEGREKLRELAGDADVFLQAYRPGALERKGFGIADVIEMKGNRPQGVICANLCAWGWEGPWKHRRGFDSLVQTATGFNEAEARAYDDYRGSSHSSTLEPRPFPVQALDHAAGYLLAYGINVALCKTITEGGSWEVRVSLAVVAQWLRSLGRIPFGGKSMPPVVFPPDLEVQSLSSAWMQAKGERKMTALKHPAVLSKTPASDGGEKSWAPMVLNSSEAKWM